MKPILIIPPDTIDAEGIKALNDNGICTVVATDPAKVQFLNPETQGYFAETAIRFTRLMLTRETFISNNAWRPLGWDEVSRLFAMEAKRETPLSVGYVSTAEKEQRVIETARFDELSRIGREEAREEAAQRKAEREAKKKSANKAK